MEQEVFTKNAIVEGSFPAVPAFENGRIRVAIYARVSTRDKGQDTTNQLDQLRALCATNGWRVVLEYQDTESGGKADRRAFCEMMVAAKRREFDVLLFWALDRFSREGVWETHQYLRRLDESGVRFRSFTEPYLDSCGMFRDAVISILAVIAKQERIRLSERVRAGLDRALTSGTRSGKPVGRPRAVFRRDIVLELRKEGRSWSQIARETGVSVASVRRACQAIPAAAEACQNPSREIL
jgi:DNA invertase Pin-like site-specific DNA recombinase